MYSKTDIKAANKTSRGAGAIGSKALVPRFITDMLKHSSSASSYSILDFGAGKDALHTKALKDGWDLNITAYDFGDNDTEYHDSNALSYTYDIIMMSNVLNVQQSKAMLSLTLTQLRKGMESYTDVYANYPSSPRYLDLTKKQLKEFLKFSGFRVDNITKDIMQINLAR